MPQLPSFRRLSPAHQAFVNAYFRANCDPTEAMMILHPQDERIVNVRRGWKMMQRPDVKEAIGDLHTQTVERSVMSKEDVYHEILDLLTEAKGLDALTLREKLGRIKASRELIEVMMKLLGYGTTNINTTEEKSITVQLVGIDPTQEVPVEIQDEQPEPKQLEMDFDPVVYDLSELDDLSGDDDDSLPFTPDPDEDSVQTPPSDPV